MTICYLIRHGETAWNTAGRFQGQQNTPLNTVGRTQADAVAHALVDGAFDALYTSDLDRATQTASVIAAACHLAPVLEPAFREASFGAWEGLTLPEIDARWPALLAAWREDPLYTRPPDGETLAEVQQRVTDAMQRIITRHPDGTVVIVAHGGSLRAIVALTLRAELAVVPHLRLDNCSLSLVRFDGETSTLLRLNDLCHLGARTAQGISDESGDQWRLAMLPPS